MMKEDRYPSLQKNLASMPSSLGLIGLIAEKQLKHWLYTLVSLSRYILIQNRDAIR